MRIEPVDLDDEVAFRRWYDAHTAAGAADFPDVPLDPPDEVRGLLRHSSSTRREEAWAASDENGTVLGGMRLWLPLLENLDAMDVNLFVDTVHRRARVGRALLAAARERARAQGRVRLVGEAPEPLSGDGSSPGAAFARAVGARAVHMETLRVLDVTAVDGAALEVLRKEALDASAGYEVVQWTGRCPDALLADVAVLRARMSTDAPMGDLNWEPEHWDSARVQADEDELAATGRLVLVSAARELRTGLLVGNTRMTVSRTEPRVGDQWDTLVLPEHRGHRLGLLLKLANLDLLREHSPGTERVNTWNAESNAPMVAVNERLGFRAVQRWREWQVDA